MAKNNGTRLLSVNFREGFCRNRRPGEHEGRGQSAPRKFSANKNARTVPGMLKNLAQALSVALLLLHEGFQEALRPQVGIPNTSERSVLAFQLRIDERSALLRKCRILLDPCIVVPPIV